MGTPKASPIETLRGDIHHHINPVIGWLRYDFANQTNVDPCDVPTGDNGLPDVTGLPETVIIGTGSLVSMVRRLSEATKVVDAAADTAANPGQAASNLDIRGEIARILDSYNSDEDADSDGECEPEDRWRLYRDLRALVAR